MSDEETFFFDKAPIIIESNLPTLFNNLVDRDHVLHYSWNMQEVSYLCLFAINYSLWTRHCWHAEWGGLCYPLFPHNLSFELSMLSKPIFMRCHVIGCTWVNKPYIFEIGGACLAQWNHWIHSMPHHGHFATIFVVGIWGIVGKLLARDGLGRIGLFFHDFVPFLRPSSNRACVLLAHCSSFGRDFLRSAASIGDRRMKEDYPWRGQLTLLFWIKVLCRWGVSAPFHRRWWTQGHHLAPWYLRCSWWSTRPFAEYRSTPVLVAKILLRFPYASFSVLAS